MGEKELKLQLVEGRKPGLPWGAAETGVRDSNSWRGQQARSLRPRQEAPGAVLPSARNVTFTNGSKMCVLALCVWCGEAAAVYDFSAEDLMHSFSSWAFGVCH